MDEATKETYERAGFGAAVAGGRTPALLVVDFSYGFTDPESQLGTDMSAEVEATGRVLEVARAANVLVVFTSIAYESSLRDGGAWIRKVPSLEVLTIGSRWIELDQRLGRRASEPILYKRGASAFFGTHLATMLVSSSVDTLIVAGATTSGCVRASVVDAVQYGFDTFVVRDCVADRAAAPHEANLFDMEAKYATLMNSDQVVQYIRSGNIPK